MPAFALFRPAAEIRHHPHAAVIEPLVSGGSMDATMKEILDISEPG